MTSLTKLVKLSEPDSFWDDYIKREDGRIREYQKQQQGFFDNPFYNRKYFYCIDGKKDGESVRGFCNGSNMTQIGIEDIPYEIRNNMPTGHPVRNTLYIGHPYKANKYIPYDEYEAYLMSEKLDEFCWLCQNLGAREIHLMNEHSLDEFCSSSSSMSVGGSYGPVSASYGSDSSNSRYNASFYRCKINQTFSNPVQTPRIPNDLVWYDHEPSWQNLYRQSTLGKGEYHVNIETGSVCMTNESEKMEIKAAIKVIRKKVGLEFSSSEERMFMQRKNAVLDILVRF